MIFHLIIFASWLVESCAYNSRRIVSWTCNLYVDPFFGPCGATPDSDRQALNLFGAIKFCDGARPCDETVRCDEIGLWRMFGRWQFGFTSNEEVAGNDLPVACLSANELFSRILGICLSIMAFLAEFGQSANRVLGAKQCFPLLDVWRWYLEPTGRVVNLWTVSSPRTFSPSLGSAVVALFPCTLLKYHNVVDPFNHFPIYSRSYLCHVWSSLFVHAMLSLHLSDGTLWISWCHEMLPQWPLWVVLQDTSSVQSIHVVIYIYKHTQTTQICMYICIHI